MRIATFNTNFFKTGRMLADMLLDNDFDAICLQRVRERDIKTWQLPNIYTSCYHGDKASDNDRSSGIITIAKKSLNPQFLPVTLTHNLQRHNSWQGNHAMTCGLSDLTIINCLPCYEEDQITIADWASHVQICMNLGSWRKSILVGDFHQEDHDTSWKMIDMHEFANNASHLNTFCSGTGHRMSLDKVFARNDVIIRDVQLALSPHHTAQWNTHGMHWPVCIELA